MPIYMDVHSVPGVRARQVAEAHRLDLAHQNDFGCTCMTYWIDETRESVFCLIDAPDKDAVRELHRKAHGLIPAKIIEVSSSVVHSFLGRIYDPEDAQPGSDGLIVFADPAFRVLLVTQTLDPVLLRHQQGRDQSVELLQAHNKVVRDHAAEWEGLEAEHGGAGFIFSFPTAAKALSCAKAILTSMPATLAQTLQFKICISAGEAIGSGSQLFGDAIKSAHNLGALRRDFRLAIDYSVKELLARDDFHHSQVLCLAPPDELLLRQLFATLEANLEEPEFDAEAFGKALAMSKSQLYRKCVDITGSAPNQLLKEFRLSKARGLLKTKRHSIAQVTFECGFSSPSYFTKCFKKEYGLLPGEYLELV